MKIAFCGDSFCANIDNRKYPTYLYLVVASLSAPKLARQGADIILNGTSGNPLYHSYMSLLEVIDKADYIIFCITEPGRLANKESLPICYGSIAEEFPFLDGRDQSRRLSRQFTIDGKLWSEFFSIPESELIKVMQSARNYYLDVMSHEFHDMAQKGILMQIDELMIHSGVCFIDGECIHEKNLLPTYVGGFSFILLLILGIYLTFIDKTKIIKH